MFTKSSCLGCGCTVELQTKERPGRCEFRAAILESQNMHHALIELHLKCVVTFQHILGTMIIMMSESQI